MKFFNDSQKQAKEYNDALPEVENKFVANVDFDVKKNSDNILSILIILVMKLRRNWILTHMKSQATLIIQMLLNSLRQR